MLLTPWATDAWILQY